MTSSPVFLTWNVIVPVGAVAADSRHSVRGGLHADRPGAAAGRGVRDAARRERDDDQRQDGDGGRDGHGVQAGHRSSSGRVVAPGGDGPGGGQAGVDTDPALSPRSSGATLAGGGADPQAWRTNRIVTGTR